MTASRWVVGDVPRLAHGDRLVALDVWQARTAADALPFHRLPAEAEPAGEVLVVPPRWRGYGFVAMLEWLVCTRLAVPGTSRVTWLAEAKGGATGVERLLVQRGWDLERSKQGRMRRFAGTPPAPGPRPQPASFEVELLGHHLTFAADWGVFSRGGVDEGTTLLVEAAAERGPVQSVADVGAGYGAAIAALLAAGVAETGIAGDVDSVAIHLLGTNCPGVEALFEDDPAVLPPTRLTVCNFPTHATRANADLLVRGLLSRAESGPVLTVVHRSLVPRYWERFGGWASEVAQSRTHTILGVGA